MPKKPRDVADHLPLPSASLHVLLALMDGDKHGYAIMQAVEHLSDGIVQMGPGTLYGTIKRLLADGLIEETAERPAPEDDDDRRRYYRASGLGERVCSAEVARLSTLIERSALRRLAPGFGT